MRPTGDMGLVIDLSIIPGISLRGEPSVHTKTDTWPDTRADDQPIIDLGINSLIFSIPPT